MTKYEKKNVMALRHYYEYLIIRFKFINLAIIDVSDKEFTRMCNTRNLYKKAFINAGFKTWLLKKNHEARRQECIGIDKQFYDVAIKLRDEILRSER